MMVTGGEMIRLTVLCVAAVMVALVLACAWRDGREWDAAALSLPVVGIVFGARIIAGAMEMKAGLGFLNLALAAAIGLSGMCVRMALVAARPSVVAPAPAPAPAPVAKPAVVAAADTPTQDTVPPFKFWELTRKQVDEMFA